MADKKELIAEIEVPDKVKVDLAAGQIKVSGEKGEISRDLSNKQIVIEQQGNKIVVKALKINKTNKKQLKTRAAHLKNMMRGAVEGHTYKLKICSGHFPMNVSSSNNELIVKNFLGEKVPRVLKIKNGATVKIEGDTITVESANKELAGQVSADIEKLTKRANYDTRIFQDGIYITNKDGKELV